MATVVPLAAGIALLVRPQSAGKAAASATVDVADGLRSKGASTPLVTARCEGSAPGKCRVGERMIFEVDGLTRRSSFGAYADCEGRERIWYFPTQDGAQPELAAAERVVVNQAVRVGTEHGVGACKLHLFLLDQPLARSALASGKAAGAVETLQTIEIEP